MNKQWATDAPECLIRAYQDRKIRNGRALLGRLLSKEWARSPWTELSRHVRDDRKWFRVWSAIAFAKAQSNKAARPHKRRTDEHDDYLQLAKKIAELVKNIENGPMDLLSYEFWETSDWAALHVDDLRKMSQEDRCTAAHKILSHWPSAVDLLQSLANRASTLASDAMKRSRPDERSRGDLAVRTFVWHLGQDFGLIFGKRLLGTLALIAEIVFDRTEEHEQISRGFVQSALRRV